MRHFIGPFTKYPEIFVVRDRLAFIGREIRGHYGLSPFGFAPFRIVSNGDSRQDIVRGGVLASLEAFYQYDYRRQLMYIENLCGSPVGLGLFLYRLRASWWR